MRLFICLVLFVMLPLTSAAAPVCHCFQERVFDPARPAAADVYFLATTQNSLLAESFAIPKRDIVEQKMSGADGDLLWVVQGLARFYVRTPEEIVRLHEQGQSWPQIVSTLDSLSGPAPIPRSALASTTALADAIVHRLLVTRLGVTPVDIAAMNAAGASRKELLLAVLVAPRLQLSLTGVLARIRGGEATWGSQLFAAGIGPKQIAAEWRSRLQQEKAKSDAEH